MPKLISLYTGAGGLDLGFEAAGCKTTVAVEIDAKAAETLRANRDWVVIDRDIHSVSSDELLKAAKLAEGDADFLIGGPPCQPFSKAGYWASGDTRRLNDPRSGTIGAYFRVLQDTLPRAFLLENVPGLAFRGKSEGLDLIESSIEQINREKGTDYTLSIAKLNAADYGTPQMRERVFIVGSRDGKSFSFPKPTHGEHDERNLFETLIPYTTAWDAIGNLKDHDDETLQPRGKWADLLPTIPEGENYLWHTERGGGLQLFGWRRRFWSFLLKLAKDRPSWTIQAQPGPAVGPFHWNNRRLSGKELSRLQTLPDDFTVLGTLQEVQRQLGNAVPSALAEVLARSMRQQLLEHKTQTKATLVPKHQGQTPCPEKALSVPRKYKALIGKHDAHPGTGKGYEAIKRGRPQQPATPLPA